MCWRATSMLGLWLAAGCASSPAVLPATPAPSPVAMGALPRPGSLGDAAPCVRAMAELRQCMSDGLTSGKSNFSCPNAYPLRAALQGLSASLPTDLQRAFDSPLRCSLVHRSPERAAEISAAGFVASERTGPVWHGTLPLGHLYCVAELDFVASLECESPSPVLQ